MAALSMQPTQKAASPVAVTGGATPGQTSIAPVTPTGMTAANQAYNNWMQQQTSTLAGQGYSQGQIQAMLNPYAQANQTANADITQYGNMANEMSGNANMTNPGFAWSGDPNATQNQDSLDYNTYQQQMLTNPGGAPSTYTDNGITYSPYVSGWNSSDALAGKYQAQVDATDGAFKQEQAEAMGAAPTGWAQAEQLKQNALSMQQKDAGAQSSASATANADDALAAQGGLSGGARERVAEGGAQNLVGMQQGIDTAALNNSLNIDTTDQQNKLSMLGNVASQENTMSQNWMQANQYDQQQQTAEAERLQAWNNMTTQQQNQAYAAQQQSNATAAAGSGGGIFG